MAYDKVVDSTSLDEGLTNIANKIREKSGTTDALSFPQGFVLAVDNIGGGKATKKYSASTSSVIKSSNNTTSGMSALYGSYYTSVFGTLGAWDARGEVSVSMPVDASATVKKYSIRNIQSNELWYITAYNSSNYILTYTIYDLSRLDSAAKTYIEDQNSAYIAGTYEFTIESGNPHIYYYGV